ncbi:MAG: IPTL-CTERM sorting domain-containing protein, partial [Xanthomonadales bacterium]|nr:IPTL-CTERM sorting domain-containing protein [Xanthomonadales bacterium]
MSESIRVRGLRGVASVVCLLMLFVAAPVAAQSYRHSVLVDSDNDVGTGCTVNSAAGSVSGIEVRLSADVSGTPPQVNSVSRETCVGGTFGMPVVVGGGYPVALNGGIGGADAIELAMAYADIPQPPAQDWRVAFLSERDNGADLLSPLAVNGLGAAPAPPATPSPDLIPTLSPGGLIGLSVAMALLLLWGARRHRGLLSVLMLCGSLAFFGVAWAANFLADGNLGDWAGVSPNGSDGSGDSTSGEVAIDIIAGFAQREGGSLFFRVDVNDAETSNHAPIVADQAFSVDENSANATAVGTVVATDSDVGDTLSYAITAGNGAGTFAMDAGTGAISVADNTALDFEVSSSFVLTVSVTDDGTPVASSSATITINVNDLNEAPTAVADSYNATEDTALNVAAAGVLANDSDPDGNTLTSVLDTGPANAASFTLNADGSFSYTPTTGFNGADSFTYHATDGLLDSATVTVSITVNAINDPPVAVDDARMTTEDFVTNIADGDPNNLLSNDSDPDGDTLTVASIDGKSISNGQSVTLNDGVIVTLTSGKLVFDATNSDYDTLVVGQSATATYSYQISDGNGGTASADIDLKYCGSLNTLESIAASLPDTGT